MSEPLPNQLKIETKGSLNILSRDDGSSTIRFENPKSGTVMVMDTKGVEEQLAAYEEYEFANITVTVDYW